MVRDLPGPAPRRALPRHLRTRLSRLDPDAFERCFGACTAALAGSLRGKPLAVDGKKICRSFEHAWDHSTATHLVGAFVAENETAVVEACGKHRGSRRRRRPSVVTSSPLHLQPRRGHDADATRVAEAVRGHGSVENQSHWVLDVSFDEDRSRVSKGHGAEDFSRVRRIALNLLASKKRGIKGKRLNAAWDRDYLLKLLAG